MIKINKTVWDYVDFENEYLRVCISSHFLSNFVDIELESIINSLMQDNHPIHISESAIDILLLSPSFRSIEYVVHRAEIKGFIEKELFGLGYRKIGGIYTKKMFMYFCMKYGIYLFPIIAFSFISIFIWW